MISRYLRSIDEMPGWFLLEDILLFEKLNRQQKREGLAGDLFEIGAYYGKSAVLLGYLVADGERLFVCDAFEGSLPTDANRKESRYAAGLTQRVFESNYRRFHHDLPEILACSSTELRKYNLSRGFRFVHIDGSHVYDIVKNDIEVAKRVLIKGGIVVFDDHCTHPGVSAAIWEEAANGDLIPFCLTPKKLYATWEPTKTSAVTDLTNWALDLGIFEMDTEAVRGLQFLKLRMKPLHLSLLYRIYRKLLKIGRLYHPHAEIIALLQRKGYA